MKINICYRIAQAILLSGLPCSFGQLAPLPPKDLPPMNGWFAPEARHVSGVEKLVAMTLVKAVSLRALDGEPGLSWVGPTGLLASPETKPGSLLSVSTWILTEKGATKAADMFLATPVAVVEDGPASADDLLNWETEEMGLTRVVSSAGTRRW